MVLGKLDKSKEAVLKTIADMKTRVEKLKADVSNLNK
jgi:archaellum component FlaC